MHIKQPTINNNNGIYIRTDNYLIERKDTVIAHFIPQIIE